MKSGKEYSDNRKVNIRCNSAESKGLLAIAVGLFVVSTPIYAGPVLVTKFDFEGGQLPCPDTAESDYTADTFIFVNKGIDLVHTGATGGAALVRADQTVNLNRENEMNFNKSTYLTFDLTIKNLAEGETLSLSAFDYTYQGFSTRYFRTALLSSVDGFEKGKELMDFMDPNEKQHRDIQPTVLHADLSGNQGFQGLRNGDTIMFRIYVGDRSDNAEKLHLVDNIRVIGEVKPDRQ